MDLPKLAIVKTIDSFQLSPNTKVVAFALSVEGESMVLRNVFHPSILHLRVILIWRMLKV